MKKTILTSTLSAIIAGLLVLGGVNIMKDTTNVYYCEDRAIVMKCDSLSKYYGLDNGKCNNPELGNKVCRSGWIDVIDDTPIKTDYSKQVGKQYLCDTQKCVEKR